TKKLGFHVCAGMHCSFLQNGEPVAYNGKAAASPTKISQKYTITAGEEDTITLHKYVVIASSLNHERKRLHPVVEDQLEELTQVGFSALLEEQARWWANQWQKCDILIEGDEAAQQGIRFNIFQLYQTYTGADARLNIGPKG